MSSDTSVHFKVIVNCGPCAKYIARCLDSLSSQRWLDWQAVVTVDPYKDQTFEQARRAAKEDSRITVTRNRTRLYAMENLVRGVERSRAALEDVILVLDGDDWLLTDQALHIIAREYARPDCWMTYGSWVSNATSDRGLWPAYPAGTRDFRCHEWLGTAVRTWKKWLWDRIDERDYRDGTGRYFRVAEDLAVMLPLLEMSGTDRARHISKALMLYNKDNPYACGRVRLEELVANTEYLRARPRYEQLAIGPAGALSSEPGRCYGGSQ